MSNDLSYIHESLKHLAVPVADLTPDPKNARKHDRRNLDAIKASLEKFGMRQPIIVQKQGMIVRAGNGRLAVAQELGWSHLPALVVDESEAEAVAFAIADNRTAELAEWNEDMLSLLVGGLEYEFAEALSFDPCLYEGSSDLSLVTERPKEKAKPTSFASKPPQEALTTLEENSIRSIVLHFDFQTHREVVLRLAELQERMGLSNNTDVVRELINAQFGG